MTASDEEPPVYELDDLDAIIDAIKAAAERLRAGTLLPEDAAVDGEFLLTLARQPERRLHPCRAPS